MPSAHGIAWGPTGNLLVCSWQGPQGGGVYEFDAKTGDLIRRLANSPAAMFVVSYNLCRADLTGSSNPNDPSFGMPDCDADADDFFAYLDLFAARDLLADINADATIDSDDFVGYLDLFVRGCD